MQPRPILKRPKAHHHPVSAPSSVHFPPSPALTRTFSAHSPQTYDRSPIQVAPNSCALPERGCPGRTYTLDDAAHAAAAPRRIACARDYHPRALAFASASHHHQQYPHGQYQLYQQQQQVPPVPALVPDLSSESDESDGFSAPLPTHRLAPPTPTSKPVVYPIDLYTPNPADDAYQAYRLPPRTAGHHGELPEGPSAPPASPHQRRRRAERRHESSRDPDRIPRGEACPDAHALGGALAGLALSSAPSYSYSSSAPYSPPSFAAPSPSPRRKGVRRTPPVATGGFGVPDDGCLGGF